MSQEQPADEPVQGADEQALGQALFDGLVFNELGEPAPVAYIGSVAHYAINDAGFKRHVEAYKVDDVVIAQIKDQVTSMQDEVVRGMLQMLGKDDIFTKAALDASIRNMDKGIRQADQSQWLPWLRLFGFRVVVNVHGEVVQIIYPTAPTEGGDDDE